MIGFIVIGIVALVLFVWYLYRRSKQDTSGSTEPPLDDANHVDDTLLTGVMLAETFDDDDEHHESSGDTDSGGYDGGDGGGFDGGGFDGGGGFE